MLATGFPYDRRTSPENNVRETSRIVTQVRPGDTVMEIVPQDDRLVVEVQLKPDDADNVHAGIPAKVRLIHFKHKFQPVVEGKVISVSADLIINPTPGFSADDYTKLNARPARCARGPRAPHRSAPAA